MCRLLPLTKNQYAIVDAVDYDWLMQWKWFAVECDGAYYAARHVGNAIPRRVYMHRLLAGAVEGEETDHWNASTLDNRRSNLRRCTPHQNRGNLGLLRNNTSGYKGVTWARTGWQAQLKVRTAGRAVTHYLGKFAEPKEAARAYDNAAKKHFGEFARLNFPEVC